MSVAGSKHQVGYAWQLRWEGVQRLRCQHFGTELSEPLVSVDRRGFLAAATAFVAGTSPSLAANYSPPSPSSASGFHLHGTAEGFALTQGDRQLWRVDLSWLADLRVAISVDAQSAVLSGRIPGTAHALRLQIRVLNVDDMPSVRIRHSLWNEAVTLPLEVWLSGGRLPTQEVGSLKHLVKRIGVTITLNGQGRMALQSDLSMTFSGDALSVQAGSLCGPFASCQIGPSPERFLKSGLTQRETVAQIVMHVESGPPMLVRPANHSGPALDSFEARHALLELVERADGTSTAGILAVAEGPVRMTHAHSERAMNARLVLDDIVYVEQGDRQGWLAGEAQATVATRDAVLRASSKAGELTRVENGNAAAQVQCPLIWDDVSLVHPDGVTMQLRRAPNGGYAPDIGRFLGGFPWFPDQLDLSSRELVALRPEDGLWMRFRFRDALLVRGLTGYRIRWKKGGAGRMWMVLPPQSVDEEAFFRPPGWSSSERAVSCGNELDAFGLPIASAPNERRKSLNNASCADWAGRRRDGYTLPSVIPAERRARGRAAGESKFCFQPIGDKPLAPRLEELLDPSRWSMVLADSAASTLKRWRAEDANRKDSYPRDVVASDLGEISHVELPFGVQISPTPGTQLVHSPLRLGHRDFHPLFSLSPVAHVTSGEFRAIYTEDGGAAPPPHPLPQKDSIRTSLDVTDRSELVWLTGRWGRLGLFGTKNVEPPRVLECDDGKRKFGVHDPQPFRVNWMSLSAFGGGMRAEGAWDPAYLRPGPGKECDRPAFGLSIEQWTHRSSLARTHFEQVLYRGWLLPFGFRASLVKRTEREVDKWGPHSTAALSQRYFIEVKEPHLRYPLTGQPDVSLNAFCQPEDFKLLLSNGIQIDDPNNANSSIAGLGQSGFWVRVNDQDWNFEIQVGGMGIGTCPLIFVDNRTVHDLMALHQVTDAYNKDTADQRCTMQMKAVPVCFAPPTKRGNTSFPTHALHLGLVVNVPLVNSTLLEAAKQPPIYPVVRSARIDVRAVKTMTGEMPPPVLVQYSSSYQKVGFDAMANPSEVFLDLVTAVPLRFSGGTQRAGAIASPNLDARHLSRSMGLLSVAPASLIAVRGVAVSPAPLRLTDSAYNLVKSPSFQGVFSKEAQLLGVLDLNKLLGAVGIEDLPRLVEQTQYRFRQAANDTSDAILKRLSGFCTTAESAVTAVINEWKNAVKVKGGAGPDPAWLASPAYQSVAAPLDRLRTEISQLKTKLTSASGNVDVTTVWGDLAAIGQSISEVLDALETVASKPEVTLGALLTQSEIGPVLEWFSTVLDSWRANLTQEISAMLAAWKNSQAAWNRALQELQSRVGELERVAVSETLQLKQSINDAIVIANGVRDASAQDLLKLFFTASGLYLPLYRIRDQLRERIAKHAATAAGVDFASALDVWIVEVKRVDLRLAFTTACITWEHELEKVWQAHEEDPPAPAVAEAQRKVQAISGDLQQWLKDVAAWEAQSTSNKLDIGFFRLAGDLFLMIGRAQQIVADIKDVPAALVSDIEKAGRTVVGKFWSSFLRCAAPKSGSGTSPAVGICDANLQLAWEQLARTARALRDSLPRTVVADVLTMTIPPEDPYAALLNEVLHAFEIVSHYATPPNLPTPAEVADVVATVARLRGLATCLSKPGGAQCLNQWPGYQIAMVAAQDVFTSVYAAFSKAVSLFRKGADDAINAGRGELARSILGPNFSDSFKAITDALASLPQNAPTTPAGWAELAGKLDAKLLQAWQELLDRLDHTRLFGELRGAALERVRTELKKLAKEFVPAQIRTDYELTTKIKVASDVSPLLKFRDGESEFKLKSTLWSDVLAGTAGYDLHGSITNFKLKLFSVITIPVKTLAFEGSSTSGFKMLPPEFGVPELKPPFDFLTVLMELIGAKNGLFVDPGASSVRVGYRFSKDLVQSGGMTLQNVDFEVGVEILFDGSPLRSTVSFGREDAPFLLSVGIYGGGGFMRLGMEGTEVKTLAARFEAGLIGAFDLGGVLRGAGRATVYLYYRYNPGPGAEGGGGFYVGGHATVLGIVSITAELEFQLTIDGGVAWGEGHFSVRVGAGFFSFTLRYSLRYQQGHSAAQLTAADYGPKRVAFAAAVASSSASIGEDMAPANDSSLDPVMALLQDDVWQQYIHAFKRIRPCPHTPHSFN